MTSSDLALEQMRRDCVESTVGSKNPSGHYRFSKPIAKEWYVHRWIYKTKIGPLAIDQKVLHKCGNAWCVNPEHLYIGSSSDNTKDAYRHGKKMNRVLTEEQAREIKESSKTAKELAKEYGVADSTIRCLTNGFSWKDLYEPF